MTYEISLWNQAGFDAYEKLIRVLQAAQSARPQQSLTLTDPRLKNLRVPAVTPVVIPHQNLESPGLWTHRVKFTENARLKIAGGPVKPARNAIEDEQVLQAQHNAWVISQLHPDLAVNRAKAMGKL